MHFSHQNFNKILNAFEAKQSIFIYTGLVSTTKVLHTGHIIPFLFAK
jgi:tyrosyl-tRNA synthetase